MESNGFDGMESNGIMELNGIDGIEWMELNGIE